MSRQPSGSSTAEAYEALNSRVQAMEQASRETESTMRGLVATVESILQLLVQQYGPLPSPLQSGLTWRRSLPPSRSMSRLGTPLAQSPLIVVPEAPFPSHPVAEGPALSATASAMISPPTEDIEMESASMVEVQQVVDMLESSVGTSNQESIPDPPPPSVEVEVHPPVCHLSDSTFGPRQRTRSGNSISSTTHITWGCALSESTGGGSSHTSDLNADTQAEEKDEQGAEAKDETIPEKE